MHLLYIPRMPTDYEGAELVRQAYLLNQQIDAALLMVSSDYWRVDDVRRSRVYRASLMLLFNTAVGLLFVGVVIAAAVCMFL